MPSIIPRIPLILCTGLLLAGTVQIVSAGSGREVYPIPDHGDLILYVPDDWNATFYQPQSDTFPVIAFYPLHGPQVFQLTVSTLWETSPLHDLAAPENLRRFVERVGKAILEYADEDTLELDEISGRTGTGYLFELSNSQAGAGEYPYLTQGALGVGNLVVVFSLFTLEKDNDFREPALEMLKDAQQRLDRGEI